MNIVILGGGGFIGSVLMWTLSFSGHDVIAAGHFRRRTPLSRRTPKGIYWPVDLQDQTTVDLMCQDADVVIHAAGPTGETACTLNPDNARAMHVLLAHHLARWSREKPGRQVIYLSSMAVYDSTVVLPFTEDSPRVACSLYSKLKIEGEGVLERLVGVSILRLAHVYGVGCGKKQDPDGVVARFLAAGAACQPIIIHGGLEKQWDFVHVSDVVACVERIIENKAEGIYNVGSGRSISLGELALEVGKVTGWRSEIKIEAAPANGLPYNQGNRWMSIARAQEQLHWEPTVELAEGLLEQYEGMC